MSPIHVQYYKKGHSEFDLARIKSAKAQGFDTEITGYITGAFINARSGVGVIYDHTKKDEFGRFADGHLIRTSDVISAEKEGRFWVLTTQNSRYVIATFLRGVGRNTLRSFLNIADRQPDTSPPLLH